MYICLKTTENTDKILEAFKERDIELTVRKGKALTFIEADETEMNKFVGFVAIYSQTLVLSSLTAEYSNIEIPFDELETIYRL